MVEIEELLGDEEADTDEDAGELFVIGDDGSEASEVGQPLFDTRFVPVSMKIQQSGGSTLGRLAKSPPPPPRAHTAFTKVGERRISRVDSRRKEDEQNIV